MLDTKYLIKNKRSLRYYLECDKVVLNLPEGINKPRPFRDDIWKFLIRLRKTEYLSNQKSIFFRPLFYFSFYKYKRKCRLFNVEIPLNCLREGIRIWHLQNIIINPNSKIGSNCSISAGVVIGQSKNIIPVIGNNVELMVGAKVLGASIGDYVAIGASALVLKSYYQEKTTIAGVPAKKISNNFPEYMEWNEIRIRKVQNNMNYRFVES
ncbi:LbetaH domain-containing protein [Enterococcus casseliflavus]|uniref:serine acetyltransferase n=1 Tax=Enterococcus casseliflavus TaxID=37734 RepID=UPI00177C8D9E|nr:serine acetyltransferase [Enterococcus casseliflavus]QOG30496.1 serine acetyltransferase [Enterococcus casseliflavus]